ncbi:MAG: Toluene efflux pump outer membrane protein TtgI precursor [Syntrophorhabdus sp. PtaU1.Bin153]|nr:MAG: Toluene efflux pump outer membrane protein TtgI precursor [Syntrophorhabdus sp. PtaU1.Bin153]
MILTRWRGAKAWARKYVPAMACFLLVFLLAVPVFCGTMSPTTPAPPVTPKAGEQFTLPAVIDYALKNNPRARISARDVETETYGIDAAKAERMPRIDFGSGAARYRYPMPLTPPVISGPFGSGLEIPEYDRNIYDAGGSFRLPLFRGGRLYRGVRVAEIRKAMAEDNLASTRQELVYNLSSVFYKIAQLDKLLAANEANVRQLEAHKQDVEFLLKAGSVPQLDLLKTDVELSHAVENRLLVRNNLESTYELLKTLMGIDDMTKEISILHQTVSGGPLPPLEESVSKALSQRPEYRAVEKKKRIYEERVKIAQGKRLPDVYAAGEYVGKAGDAQSYKENWYAGVRLSIPVFDGGLIAAEVNKEKVELQKVREEERSLKLSITREVKDAYLAVANAVERIDVGTKAIESARENVRVERLKYQSGAGTATDYLDAQTAYLRAETDYCQALYDRETALAFLRKAVGEHWPNGAAGDQGMPEK